MNKDIAIELIKESGGNIEKLCELMLWSYGKGWEESREELNEEIESTDMKEFLKTR